MSRLRRCSLVDSRKTMCTSAAMPLRWFIIQGALRVMELAPARTSMPMPTLGMSKVAES